MKRVLLIALLVIAVLGVAGVLFVRRFLRSPEVAQQVTQRLEAAYGGPVRVGSVDVGLGGSTLSDFELFEQGTDATTGTPWLKVGSLTTDISLWDIIRGQALPKNVTVKDARVVLQFDADGHLTTRFPGRTGSATGNVDLDQIPDIVLEQSDVVLHKQGQPELIAHIVSAHLNRGADGKVVLTGAADSPDLGKLLLDGSINPESHEAVVTLKTEGKVHVTQSVLDRLPFIPALTWQELQVVEGVSPASLTVRYNLADAALHWHLALAPEQATVRIPALDLAAHDVSGKLDLDDYRIDLRKAHGKAYGGTVKLDGDLDFSGTETKLSFPKIVLTGLNLSEVPDSWNKAELETLRRLAPTGSLSGTASVEITMGPGKLAPAAVDSLVGLAATPCGPARWLPAVTALATFPQREVHTVSRGKATITGVAGGTAEIDLKLGPHNPPAARKTSAVPAGPQEVMLAALATTATAVQNAGAPGDYPAINARLGRAAGELLGGVDELLHGIVDFGSRFVRAVPKKVEPPAPVAPAAPTTYLDLDLNLKLKDVDLAQFVKGLGTKLKLPIEGKMSVQVKVSIPTNRASDLKEYRATGAAQATQVVLAGVKVERMDADIAYKNGVLDLTALKGRFAAPEKGQDPQAGTFTGHGKLQVSPLGALTAELTVDRVPVSAIAEDKLPITGTVSGQVTLRAPANKLKDLGALEGDGKLTADGISTYGLTLQQASTSVVLKKGVLSLPDIAGKLEGTPVTGSAELQLAGDYPFKARLNLDNWDLSALEKLAAKGKQPPVQLAGAFTTTVDLQGTTSPFKLTASGDASTAGLKINAFQVSSVKFHWTTDGKKLDLTNVDLRLYGGQAAGTAVLPLEATAAGSVNLKLSNLDAHKLVKDLALPIKVEGELGGALKGTMPPAPQGQARTATMALDVTAPKLRVQNIPTTALHGTLDYKSGVVDYKLEGKSLGGTFEIDGQVPSLGPVKKESRKGKLRIQDISLRQLTEVWGVQDSVPIGGRLSVNLDFTHDTPDRLPDGKGRLRIDNLRWQKGAVIESVNGEIGLERGVLHLRQMSGEIAQGTARLRLSYDLNNPQRSDFNLRLENVEASELLAPWFGDKIKGAMQAHIRGTLGSSWRGTANLELTRGEVYGLEVSAWRLPADWHYAPGTGRGQVDVRATSAGVARGRVEGKVSATWDYGLRLDGNLRVTGVDLQTLIRPFFGQTTIGSGQVTGQITFTGSEVRSVNDLTGNIVASFSQTEALQMPVLRQVAPFLRIGPSTTFQRGVLRARLDRGVVRIQQLALEGGTLRVHMDGTVTLAGQLNLGVLANAGYVGAPNLRIGVLGLRMPIAGPLPISFLQEAAVLLSSVVIYVDVTGTVHSPVVRLQPLRSLSEEAARFFLLNKSNMPVPLTP